MTHSKREKKKCGLPDTLSDSSSAADKAVRTRIRNAASKKRRQSAAAKKAARTRKRNATAKAKKRAAAARRRKRNKSKGR